MTIHTDKHGRPVERPKREDFKGPVQFIRALNAYHDKLACIGNAAFAAAFAKAQKGTK